MLTAALVAFVVTLALEPVVIKQLTRRAILDVPVDRSNHTVPTPRGGGVAVIAGVLVATLVAWNSAAISLLGGILIAAAVGGLEDVRGIRIVPRLLLTTVAALALLAALTVDDLPDGVAGGLLIVVAVPWTLAVVNAVNFMDGINGISAVTAVIGGSAYALIGKISDVETLTILGLAVAGAGLGFAPYNVFRARVFLGDIGSYGLGAAFAAMSLLAVAKGLPPEAAAAPLGLYLADTGTTILRRARAGEQWHLPHKQHVYQRLVALGLPHVGVSAAVGAITAACSALGMVSLSGSVMARAAADLALLVLLGVYLACPRLLQGLLGRARSRQ